MHPEAYREIRQTLDVADNLNKNVLSLLDEVVEVTEKVQNPRGTHAVVNYAGRSIEIGKTARLGTLYEELLHFRDLKIFETKGFVGMINKLGLSPTHERYALELQQKYGSLWGTQLAGNDSGMARRIFEDLVNKRMSEYFNKPK
jgi:hypothetical protein